MILIFYLLNFLVTPMMAQTQLAPGAKCSPELKTGSSFNITIRNLMDDNISVFWMDPDCVPTWYRTIPRSARLVQPSYPQFMWSIVQNSTGIVLERMTTTDGSIDQYNITGPSPGFGSEILSYPTRAPTTSSSVQTTSLASVVAASPTATAAPKPMSTVSNDTTSSSSSSPAFVQSPTVIVGIIFAVLAAVILIVVIIYMRRQQKQDDFKGPTTHDPKPIPHRIETWGFGPSTPGSETRNGTSIYYHPPQRMTVYSWLDERIARVSSYVRGNRDNHRNSQRPLWSPAGSSSGFSSPITPPAAMTIPRSTPMIQISKQKSPY